MLDLARRNQAEAGISNVHWLRGHIEQIPLPAATVDVIISNCVINLSGDKPQVLREAARVLKPGGRFAVSDVVADPDMDQATRDDMAAYTGCIAGALTRDEFTDALTAAGLTDITITETHRVHRPPPRRSSAPPSPRHEGLDPTPPRAHGERRLPATQPLVLPPPRRRHLASGPGTRKGRARRSTQIRLTFIARGTARVRVGQGLPAVASALAALSRTRRREILPVAVRGISSPTSTAAGT